MFTLLRSLPTAAKIAGGLILGAGAAYAGKKIYDRATSSTSSSRGTSRPKKAIPKKTKAKVKKAADRLLKDPSAANLKKAAQAAKDAGIQLPKNVASAAGVA